MMRDLILRAKASLIYRMSVGRWVNQRHAKDPSGLVNSLYRTAFGRPADPEGLANRVNQIQSGVSLEVLAEEFAGSPEFQTRHGSSQKLDAAYLTSLYRYGLGREPDLEGLAYWLAEGEKGATRAKTLAAFAGSDEAINRGVIPLVNSLFFSAFGRNAGEEELANHLRQIQSGVSLEVLAEKPVGSAEFQ